MYMHLSLMHCLSLPGHIVCIGCLQMGGVAAARAIPVRKRKVWIPDVYDDAVIKYCQQCMSNGTAPDAVYVGQKLIGGREGAAAIKAIKRRPAVYTLWKEAVAAAKQGGIAAGGVAASSSAPPRGFSESAKINRCAQRHFWNFSNCMYRLDVL